MVLFFNMKKKIKIPIIILVLLISSLYIHPMLTANGPFCHIGPQYTDYEKTVESVLDVGVVYCGYDFWHFYNMVFFDTSDQRVFAILFVVSIFILLLISRLRHN